MVFGRHTLDGRADTVLSVPHEKERGAASGAGRVGQLRPLDSIRLNGVRRFMEGQESDAKPVIHGLAWRLAGIPLANYDMMPDPNRDRTATRAPKRQRRGGNARATSHAVGQGPALISTPIAPAFLLGQVAVTAGRFSAHSAKRSPTVVSPEGCWSMVVKPDPVEITAVFDATPNAPYATSFALANAASAAVNVVTAVPLTESVCTIAPDPLVPDVLTPLHCEIIH
jgi:hypothetical protein